MSLMRFFIGINYDTKMTDPKDSPIRKVVHKEFVELTATVEPYFDTWVSVAASKGTYLMSFF